MNTYDLVLGAAGEHRRIDGEGEHISVVSSTGVLRFKTSLGDQVTLKPGDVFHAPKVFASCEVWSSAPNDAITINVGLGFTIPGNLYGNAGATISTVQGAVIEDSFLPFTLQPVIVGAEDGQHNAATLQILRNMDGGDLFAPSAGHPLAVGGARITAPGPFDFGAGTFTPNLPLNGAKQLTMEMIGINPGDIYLVTAGIRSGGMQESIIWRDKFGAIVDPNGQITTDGIFHADVTRYNYITVDERAITVAPSAVYAMIGY